MDFVAVTGVNYFLRRREKWARLLLSSMLSSVLGLILLIWIQDAQLYQIVVHFLLNTVMVAMTFGIKSRYQFLENWAVTYLAVVLSGGAMQWMEESGTIPGGFLVHGMVVGLLGYIVWTYFMQRKAYGNHVFPAEIRTKLGGMSVKAYWDSGNQLRDPYTGKAVSILRNEMAAELLGDTVDGIRYVPFRSLGEESGLLKVVSVEEIVVYDGNRVIRMEKTAIGIAGEGLLEGKDYDLILHASLL